MNIVFILISLISIIILIINQPSSVITVMLSGATDGITLCIKLCAIYTVWLSVLKMMEVSGISEKLAKLFKPITSRLFKGEKPETYNYISMNFATNMLGMGGAATPLGMKAMEKMQNGEIATKNMVMFLVINTTSIQLLPATVIALRSQAGSISASDIILPSLIASAVSTVVGMILVKVFVHE